MTQTFYTEEFGGIRWIPVLDRDALKALGTVLAAILAGALLAHAVPFLT